MEYLFNVRRLGPGIELRSVKTLQGGSKQLASCQQVCHPTSFS